MIVEGVLPIFLCGVFGGTIGELLKWYRLRISHRLPQYIHSPFYWLMTILIIISGGVLTVLYSTEKMNAMIAVNIGLTAPLLIQNLSTTLIANKKLMAEEHTKKTNKSLSRYLGIKNQLDFWSFLSG